MQHQVPEQSSSGHASATTDPAALSFEKLVRSFRFAFAGMWHVLRTEQNMRIHCGFTVFVVAAGFFFRISAAEWGLIFLCVGAVMAAECFNSGIERLADRISQEEHYLIQVAKDAAAGGVLMVSWSSAVVGTIIFLPKVWAWLTGAS